MVERYNASRQQPLNEASMAASLTNQDEESGQAAESAVTVQAGWLAGKAQAWVMAFKLSFLMGSGTFFPLIKIIYESKIILESSRLKGSGHHSP